MRPIESVDTVVAAGAPRRLSGQFWHQGPVSRGLVDVPERARHSGRYHRRGEAPSWYASSSERAAWAELFRHHLDVDLDPFQVRRRVGRVSVASLRVLDLTDPAACQRLGVTGEQLVADDLTVCQQLADAARRAGLGGILAPSAALPAEQTLAVFPKGLVMVAEEHARVQRPPRSMLVHLDRIPALASDIAARYRRLLGSGRDVRR